MISFFHVIASAAKQSRFVWIATSLSLLAMTCIPPASASPLIADLSNYDIRIDAGFNGTRLFLFGARSEGGDIVVVVRGPQKNYILRKKEEIGGIWLNRDRMKFFDVPSYYAVASSKPLTALNQPILFSQLGIGEHYVLPTPTDISKMSLFNEFEQAFLDHHHAEGLYISNAEPVTFMGETLFKTTIEFPSNIPPGEYTAEIYLLSDGEVVGMQSTPISVVKSGMDAFLYDFARRSPALYGITAVLMALAAGWAASRLFEPRA